MKHCKFLKIGYFSIRICFYHCSMARGSEVMCRKKVDTPWSIYRVFTVLLLLNKLFFISLFLGLSFQKHELCTPIKVPRIFFWVECLVYINLSISNFMIIY